MNLELPVTEEEHQALQDAAWRVVNTLRGVLFRLVFGNHRALADQEENLRHRLGSEEQRTVNWPEEHTRTQLAFANWLGSVRWLLDHTQTRLHDDPDRLKQFQDSTHREFDRSFAYRLMYKLRDYTTHCDLPPLWMHIESHAVGTAERTDNLAIQLQPEALLKSWHKWGAQLKNDLAARSEPIELMPMVGEAMACIERVMLAIIAGDLRADRAAAQLVIDAVERLAPEALDGQAWPTLFAADVEGTSVTNVSPMTLPIAEARGMLNPPSAPSDA